MIALVTTYFLVFYILVPGILFRFASSFFVRLKLFQRTSTQEATFSVAVALLPFALALFGVWHLPVMRHQPFSVIEGTNAELRQDYHQVATLLTSSDTSKLLGGIPAGSSAAIESNWQALTRVVRRQERFLSWYFIAAALEGWLFGYLASRYGDWKIFPQKSNARFSKSAPGSFLIGPSNVPRRLYNLIAPKLILPNVSEWHMLLTSFSWPEHTDIFVSVDILQNDGHLYQGRVADYFIDADGKLTGILLEDVSRFDRQAYLDAKAASSEIAISSEDFWKAIPSRHFYIGYSSISNLNVRFTPQDKTLVSIADEILQEGSSDHYEVVVSSDEDDPSPSHPDLYT